MRKTWREKMNPDAKMKLIRLEKKYMGAEPGAKMLVATPEIVRDYISSIPRGQTRTAKQIRDDLARSHKAQITCPTSTGIFVRIAAEAALEELNEGKSIKKITPFWRAVDPDSPAAQKLTCGPDFVRARRKEEDK